MLGADGGVVVGLVLGGMLVASTSLLPGGVTDGVAVVDGGVALELELPGGEGLDDDVGVLLGGVTLGVLVVDGGPEDGALVDGGLDYVV